MYLEYYLGRTETPVVDEDGNPVLYTSGAMAGKPKVKITHNRKKETLPYYLIASPKTPAERQQNKKILELAKRVRYGKITRAAILLLGNPVALQKIHPANAQITWVWKDTDGEIVDYEHYTIPYILAVDKIFAKIRNKTMRELPGGTLFPDTMKQYEDYSIREALHNCIAHQDYSLGGRITLVENEGFLYYSNRGSFIPGSVEKVLRDKGPQKDYRNTCLSHGMVHFNILLSAKLF